MKGKKQAVKKEKTDVRVIAATNKNLSEMVEELLKAHLNISVGE